jgi:histidyl-tRNA synthetase
MAIEPKTLQGFRDLLPELMAPRQAMIRAIEATFEAHGFAPLQTPALEYLEVLAGKYGDEGDKLLYRFQDRGERHVALRYDLTVPLARVVAQHRGVLQMPFRRYQIAPVWRADRPQRGRFREFYQCDADIAGVDSAMADAEVLSTGLGVLRALGVEGARLHLNHRDVLFGLLEAEGVTDHALQVACIRAIDKLDKESPAKVRAEMLATTGHGEATVDAVLQVFLAGHDVGTLRARAGERLAAACARIEQVLALVEAAGFGGKIVFDPTIARGLDYYTGIVYETRLTDPKVAGVGAVMSGGRYDGLIGLFCGQTIPAVGISLGLDRLLAALQELGLVAGHAAAQVYATVFAPEQGGAMLEHAARLRAAGLSVELDLAGGKLGKQLERASKRGARVALVAGPDEVAAGAVTVKDLRAGQQQQVTAADLIAAVTQIVGE